MANTQAPEVVVLTGERHVIDLLIAIKSFIQHFPLPAAVSIYADSSLTAEGATLLRSHLPQAQILSRAIRDQQVDAVLRARKLDHCIAFRRKNPFAAKVIDNAVCGQSRTQILHDTDVLSFRRLALLAELVSSEESLFCFGRDPLAEPYAVPAVELEQVFRSPIRSHINAGFAVVPREQINLEQINTWLSWPMYPMCDHFAEQMLWPGLIDLAVRSGRSRFSFLPESDYNMGRTVRSAENHCALVHYCGHYLGRTRYLMQSRGQRVVLRRLPTS